MSRPCTGAPGRARERALGTGRAGLRRRLPALASGCGHRGGRRRRGACCSSARITTSGWRRIRALRAAACAAVERWGCGAGSSRLVAGHFELHAELEAKLATLEKDDAALLFPSGYQANVGAITTLGRTGGSRLQRRAQPRSIIDGCRLSRATVHVYPHRNVRALEELLATTRAAAGD
jgi:hypothetical protein